MLQEAAATLGLDLAASYLIGNHETDVEAAVAAGATPLFVASGPDRRAPAAGVAGFPSLQAAVLAVLAAGHVKGPGPPRP